MKIDATRMNQFDKKYKVQKEEKLTLGSHSIGSQTLI